MSERGINPVRVQENTEKAKQAELELQQQYQQQVERDRVEQAAILEEQRKLEEAEIRKRGKKPHGSTLALTLIPFVSELLAAATPQEHAVLAKLNQAKVMGVAIMEDALTRVENLELFVSQISTIKSGLPFARAINGLSPVCFLLFVQLIRLSNKLFPGSGEFTKNYWVPKGTFCC